MITINDFPYNINDLKNACKNKKIIWKEHATQRLLQRKILRDEVIQCVLNGEIIENYISDKPFASCLVFEYIKYENDSNMLINAVDYMMPSILKSFHIDIIDNETYIATPIAIYIE